MSATDSYCFMVRDRNSVYSLVSVSTTERVLVSIMNTATQYWQCIPAWTNAEASNTTVLHQDGYSNTDGWSGSQFGRAPAAPGMTVCLLLQMQ